MYLNFGKRLQMLLAKPIPVQALTHPLLEEKQVQLAVLRLDLVDPQVSGNKFYKLKYNLAEAKKKGKKTILTFGGAFSNHIYAAASAARQLHFTSIGVIRGEDADRSNPTLTHAKNMGMHLHFVDRNSYRQKNSAAFLENLSTRFGDFYLIPEGGTNELAIQGTAEIVSEAHELYSHICVSIGTGGTFTGIASRIKKHQKLIGFSALKGEFIHQEVENLLAFNRIQVKGAIEIRTEYNFGGYGKHKQEQIEFMKWFYNAFKIPLDPIYTGKMMFGVWDLIQKEHFPSGSNVLLIHTGGLQGNAGFAAQTGIHLPIL
ncbi:1-aminocyclopropane-1-carboxylate deaminase/D-cysteine desulfhydrase [Algoriphagus litoralis]|uniref:1-aminocyclopropane-1-carboxylate deaminase/D-cysteine desulfhydrase n=1 Tax=Algoriphagus litoralis TaxID=2202829 RepID=UPI001E4F2C3C|nr:pyridoxal-phosphate dependent enzyme [Algoriphagus litoralis]